VQFLFDLTSTHPGTGLGAEVLMGGSTAAQVAAGNWNNAAGGSWALPTNWSSNTLPSGPGAQASLGLIIAAPRTVTLDGDVFVGNLVFNNANAYTLAQGTGGTLFINNAGSTGSIQVLAGSHSISAPVSLDATGVVTNVTGGSTLTMSGNVSGSGGITKLGAGTLILSGSNSFNGMAVNAGTTSVSSDANLGAVPGAIATNIQMFSGTLLATATFTTNANRRVDLGGVGGTIDSSPGVDFTIAGPIVGGAGTLTKGSNNSKLILLGTNTYAGSTVINGGILQIGNGGAGAAIGFGSIINSSALVFFHSDSVTLNQSISGIGSLTHTGGGTLTLAATNTYTGQTIIDGGLIAVSADNNLGTPPGAPATNITFNTGRLQATSSFTLSANRQISLGRERRHARRRARREFHNRRPDQRRGRAHQGQHRHGDSPGQQRLRCRNHHQRRNAPGRQRRRGRQARRRIDHRQRRAGDQQQ
jgi:fibronectin-binding autotransporter adhesin